VRVGDQSEAKSVQDLSSIELINQVTSLNKGIDPVSGLLPDGPINLFAGAAADPNCKGFDGLRRRIELKKKAGSKFLQTQMVMEPKILEKFCQEITQPLKIPVLAGVFLLKSAKNAQFINRVVPGACIPQSIISRLENSKHPIDEGISIAAEQVKLFLGIAQGVHIMAIKAEEQISMILDRANIN
jgi:methylenetetrahydrofolate reductase (NADPH)